MPQERRGRACETTPFDGLSALHPQWGCLSAAQRGTKLGSELEGHPALHRHYAVLVGADRFDLYLARLFVL